METEDGNCYLSQRHALFCEESLGKIDAEMSMQAFRERVGPRILLLECVDYFRASEYFTENFDGEAINWSGVVNFHCMKMSLVMSMRFIFGDD